MKRVKDKLGRYRNVGKVVQEEIFGGLEQYTVDFGEEGIHRLKASELEVIRDLIDQLYDGDFNLRDYVLRLRASRMFNDDLRTGSLSRMRLDMLPHQILIADKATSTKTKGFLIADDVGLGKTIEAGLVIRSMIAHGRADRILLICPANLTPQWREQLSERFDEWFDILRTEVRIIDSRKWDHIPRMIASIQTLRLPHHRDKLLESSQDWDLVVVDEAHHLTAREYGRKIDRTKNYQLLEKLRERSGFYLFLTATPHQGDDDRFAFLLRLLDPAFVGSSQDLDGLGPRINEIMGRNLKSSVTDFEGRMLIKGHDMHRHEVEPSEDFSRFLDGLKAFVLDGLTHLDSKGGARPRAENFVLTSFLKLAASSPDAIRRTLVNRQRKLQQGGSEADLDAEHDLRYEGEFEERVAETSREMFDGEVRRIGSLLGELKDIDDPKLGELDRIITEEGIHDDTEKRLLVFTEYRGTQDAIVRHLEGMFGEGAVLLMNGDMDIYEKRRVIKDFEKRRRFLVSTEAGGEGLDLHTNCHTLVNYDIPWNPMRLHQRTGRLDRYGQKERVSAHYIVVNGTIDEKIQSFLVEKIGRIERSLGDLKGDKAESLREDILGQTTLSRQDISRLYLSDDKTSKERLDNNVEDAIEAYKRQEKVFNEIRGFNLEDVRKIQSEFALGDLEALIKDYLASRSRRLVREDGGKVHFELPEEIKELNYFRGRRLTKSRLDGVFDRGEAERLGTELLGTGNEYIDAMLDRMVKRPDSGHVLASRVEVPENHPLSGKKGLLATCLVTSVPVPGGKQSFDGVDFAFYVPDEDTLLYHTEDTDSILETICDEKKHTQLRIEELPDRGVVSKAVEEIEAAFKGKSREGKMGSIDINSIVWIEFTGGA